MSASKLEDDFLKAWLKAHPRIKPECQYRWHPTRKYRADFFFAPDLIVEIMGTRSYKSAHTTVQGYHRDCIRMNEAVVLGFRVLYFDSMFDKDWASAVKIVERALGLK